MAENTIEIELYIDHVGHALYIPLSTARMNGRTEAKLSPRHSVVEDSARPSPVDETTYQSSSIRRRITSAPSQSLRRQISGIILVALLESRR
jgi:hypothetical protein